VNKKQKPTLPKKKKKTFLSLFIISVSREAQSLSFLFTQQALSRHRSYYEKKKEEKAVQKSLCLSLSLV